jgi:hypothetical protein
MDTDYRLGEERRARLAVVLDLLIPADARRGMPGAGEVCVDAVEASLRGNAGLRLVVEPGLDTFGNRERGTGNGAAALETVQREMPGFVPTLVFLTYSAYYQQPRVVAALGLEARPPHPGGYEMAPSDLDALLKKVRARGPLYREPGTGNPER